MARIIPAVANIELPDSKLATPRKPIKAGSAADVGHLAALGSTCNLAHATGCADTGFAMAWGDGQLVIDTAAVWTELCRFRRVKVSAVHVDMLVSAYAYSHSGGTGTIRFTCLGNANTASVVLGGALAITARSVLDLTGGFVVDADGDYVEILVETKDKCTIRNIWTQIEDYSPGSLYPAADDAYPAGPVGSFVPFDDLELVPDSPVSADWLTQRRSSLEDVRARQRQVYTWAGVVGRSGASLYAWPAPMQQMVLLAAAAGTVAEGKTFTLWARGTKLIAGDDVAVEVYDYLHRRLGGVTFQNGDAATWRKAEINVPERPEIGAPADYPSFVVCYVQFTSQRPYKLGEGELEHTYSLTRLVDSVSIWGQ